ncbi:MAG: hypothetical protein KGS47_16985 [Chloroflexi bacterium]|nr:hypothetical protein [Chloroflexota bacterium]
MTAPDLATLAALHADLRLTAMRHAEIAARGGEHADREAADAVIAHRQADALEALLERHVVYRAPEGQLSMFSDGSVRT